MANLTSDGKILMAIRRHRHQNSNPCESARERPYWGYTSDRPAIMIELTSSDCIGTVGAVAHGSHIVIELSVLSCAGVKRGTQWIEGESNRNADRRSTH